MFRLTLLFALLAATPSLAQTAPRYHTSGASDSIRTADRAPRYSGEVYAPLWEYRFYPKGIKPGATFYRYYRHSWLPYPMDSYDRNKAQRYPVR